MESMYISGESIWCHLLFSVPYFWILWLVKPMNVLDAFVNDFRISLKSFCCHARTWS